MSESTVEPKPDNAKEAEDDICKDYMRGRCDRKFCKYKHEALSKNLKLNFCHDFQNSFCPRPNCKFIHCSPDEEDSFKKTGAMTNRILVEATRKNQIPGIQPVCNEFRKGTCRRTNCRYRHVTRKEEDAEILEFIQSNSHKIKFPRNDTPIMYTSGLRAFDRDIDFESNNFYDHGPKYIKRRLISDENPNINEDERYYYEHSTSPSIREYTDEDIASLQCEVASLKRQLQEATANNLFLSDENEALRLAAKRRMAAPGSSLTDQATAPTQQVIRTVTAGVTSIPVSIATVPVSLTTVPVSLTTVTTGNRVTISAVPSVSIAPTAQLLAQSPQILVTPSTQLAIANNSQAQLTIASTAQQLAVANVSQQLTLTNQPPQQLALASQNQQQITLTNPNQQQMTLGAPNQQQLTLTNQNHQQIALVNQNQQQVSLTNQGQQLALANQNQQQITLGGQGQQILAPQQLELQGTIETSQPIDLSSATRTIVSYAMLTRPNLP